MPLYKCSIPGCGFSSWSRNEVDRHHVVPRHMLGSDKPFNRMDLCPTCHRSVYVPGATFGNHSILKRNSIVVVGGFQSSSGKVWVMRTVLDGKLQACSGGTSEVLDFGDLSSHFPAPTPVQGEDSLGVFIGYI